MNKMWFSHKHFGYGAGLPISWEGWMVIIVYVAALAALLSYAMPNHLLTGAFGVVILTCLLIWIAHAKTAPTRAKRINETAERASRGERANQWPRA